MAAIYDSSTGVYLDPRTGAASLDPYGTQAVSNPSLVEQAKRNLAVSHGLLGQLAGYGKQFTDAVGGEQALSRHLADVIAGNSPSVAQAQLQQGLGRIRQEQDSMASGTGGSNAALARMNASANVGNAQANANQSAALIRAQEVAQAERNQGAVLGNIAGQSAGMYGTNLSGAGTFSGQAGNEAAEQARIDAEKDAANKRLITNLIAAGGATAATIATGGAAAPLVAPALAGLGSGQSGNSAANSAGINGAVANPAAIPANQALDETISSALTSGPSDYSANAILGPQPLSQTDQANLVNTATGLSAGTAYTSDKREKTNIKKAPIEEFLDSLSSHGEGKLYNYTHPGTPGEAPGNRIGPMAQDVQKSAIGRTIVVGGRNLQIDIPNAVGGTLAAVSYLNDEIKKLKGSRA